MARSSDGNRAGTQNPRAAAAGLALLRVFVGITFLLSAVQRWDWIGTQRLVALVTDVAATVPGTFYAHFLTQSVIPHQSTAIYVIVCVEAFAGALLVLGLLTRATAVVALMFSANLILAASQHGAAALGWNESLVAVETALLVAGAGRFLGLDARLARKRPRFWLW